MTLKSVKCLSPLNHVVIFCAPKIPDPEPLLSKLSLLLAGLILPQFPGDSLLPLQDFENVSPASIAQPGVACTQHSVDRNLPKKY